MIQLCFIFITLIYTISAFMSYSKTWHEHWSYFPLGVLVGMVSSFLWFYVSKLIVEPTRLVKIGLYWDVLMTGCFLLVPILFFETKLTSYNWLGIVLIVAGIVLTKV